MQRKEGDAFKKYPTSGQIRAWEGGDAFKIKAISKDGIIPKLSHLKGWNSSKTKAISKDGIVPKQEPPRRMEHI